MNSLSWANLSVGGLKLIDISRVSSRTPEDLQTYDFYDVYAPLAGQSTVQNCPDPLENSALCKARGPTPTKGRCPSSTGQVGVTLLCEVRMLTVFSKRSFAVDRPKLIHLGSEALAHHFTTHRSARGERPPLADLQLPALDSPSFTLGRQAASPGF